MAMLVGGARDYNDFDPDLDVEVDPAEDAYWHDVALDRESEDAVAEAEVASQCAACGGHLELA